MVMGPSGSGKSTLIAALSGLLRPEEGRVDTLDVDDLWKLSVGRIDRFRLDHCGFIFQGFNLFPALTALQQVEVVLKFQGLSKADAKTRATATLKEVGLGPRLQPAALGPVGRREAARRHRPRPGQEPADPVRRRTDLGARRRERPDRHPPAAPRRHRTRRRRHLRDPRPAP